VRENKSGKKQEWESEKGESRQESVCCEKKKSKKAKHKTKEKETPVQGDKFCGLF
jgi:hypothetical protein